MYINIHADLTTYMLIYKYICRFVNITIITKNKNTILTIIQLLIMLMYTDKLVD